jgi:outer membrane protein assembly factor BamB
MWDVDLGSALVDTPSLIDGLLLIGTFEQQMVAFQPGESQPIWTLPTQGLVWGNPAAADGVAYFGDVAGVVYAFHPEDGSEVWQFAQPNAVVPTPALDNGSLFFVTQDGEVFARSAADHSQIWQTTQEQKASLGRLLSDPRVQGEMLLVASIGGDRLLTAFDSASGDVRWSFAPTD